MEPFVIDIPVDTATPELRRLIASIEKPEPAMRAIATALLSQGEANFAAESGPLGKWPALAQATIEKRADRMAGGVKGGKRKDGRLSKKLTGRMAAMKILQDTGRLAASVTPFWSDTEAGVGSNAIQAAIQQLGGAAGRNHASLIPARPYLPATEDGLQPEAAERVMDELQKFLLRV